VWRIAYTHYYAGGPRKPASVVYWVNRSDRWTFNKREATTFEKKEEAESELFLMLCQNPQCAENVRLDRD
jgi:hypothetical protein